MKTKHLLITALVLVFGFTVFAQKGLTPINKFNKIRTEASVDPVQSPDHDQTIVNAEAVNYTNSSRDIEKIVLGMSGNIWGFMIDNTNPLSYSPEIGTLGLIARADPATHPEAATNGTMMGHHSFDMGTTWEDPCYVYNPDGAVANPRYPNGTIFNPAGNTDPAEAYLLAAGPAHLSSAWVLFFDASSKIDGCSNNYGELHDWDDAFWANAWSGTNFFAFEDGVARYTLQQVLADYSDAQISLWEGSWEDDHFEYEEQDPIEFDFTLEAGGYANRRGMWVGGDDGYGMAWAPDGQLGYAFMVGQDEDVEDYGFIPVIFMTEDGGDNWDKIEYDMGDVEDVLEPYIYETVDGEISPAFHETRCCVDGNGNLQILALTAAHYSNHVDSLTYSWVGDYGHFFNFEFSPEGIEKAIWLDSCRTDYVDDANEYAFGDGTFWNHRIQISKDPSGMFIFFTWTDTWDETYEVNARPDIFGNFRSINDDEMVSEETIEFTRGSGVTDGFYFFTYASPIAIADGLNFSIPYIQVLTPPEYFADDDIAPATIHYVKGIDFVYDAVEENFANASLEVSQNIPNPATGLTRLNLNLDAQTEVTVQITNIMGQQVYTHKYGVLSAGTNSLEFDASTWDAGVYFYTVSTENAAVTKKMIVE